MYQGFANIFLNLYIYMSYKFLTIKLPFSFYHFFYQLIQTNLFLNFIFKMNKYVFFLSINEKF